MATYPRTRGGGHRRRAVVAVQVGVVLIVLLGFAALTVDVGTLYNTRGDLQRTADAAALAGASAYVTDEMMQVRLGTEDAGLLNHVTGLATTRVTNFASINPTLGQTSTHVDFSDIVTGWINVHSGTEPIHANPLAADYNAVYVLVRREAEGGEGANGPVPFFFAAIFGKLFGESSASAVAVFDDRVSGFTPGLPGDANLLPFTIREEAYYRERMEGGDSYSWNGNSVDHSPDGTREVRLYPYPLSGSEYYEGDGNFGTLNIGTGNQGVTAEELQILNGVTQSDLEMEIGTPEATFYGDAGEPITYEITGSPGLEASLRFPITEIMGKVVGFFLHSDVVLSGSNAIYTITEIRFGRVMDIRLTGNPNQRGFFIQPVSYNGGGVQIDPDAPSTDGEVGRLVLAR